MSKAFCLKARRAVFQRFFYRPVAGPLPATAVESRELKDEPMNMMTRLPPPPAPPGIAAFSALIALANRTTIEAAIETLVDELNARDGDPDLEPRTAAEGWPDGLAAFTDAEDVPDFAPRSDRLPGTVEDAEPNDDAAGDPAWIEWHTRGAYKVDVFGAETMARGQCGIADEDVEDDDPREDDDPAEDADSDRCAAGDDHMIAGPVADAARWWQRREDLWFETDDSEPQFVPADMHAVPVANDA